MIHHSSHPCGLTGVDTTHLWPAVTCGPCRLEQPQTAQPGQVEYSVPEHVLAEDRRQARRTEMLAELDEAQENCLAEIRYWSERMAECIALREKLTAKREAPDFKRLDPQDFLDGLAGYAARQREALAPRIAPWHP